jgi:hypothetical protein
MIISIISMDLNFWAVKYSGSENLHTTEDRSEMLEYSSKKHTLYEKVVKLTSKLQRTKIHGFNSFYVRQNVFALVNQQKPLTLKIPMFICVVQTTQILCDSNFAQIATFSTHIFKLFMI